MSEPDDLTEIYDETTRGMALLAEGQENPAILAHIRQRVVDNLHYLAERLDDGCEAPHPMNIFPMESI